MDLTFKIEGGRFNYRVGAIIIHDEKLLMIKNEYAPYLYTIGGRVKMNETAEEAVVREVFEETGMKLEVDRLGFVHENFFVEEVTKERFHEIAFFFFMKVEDKFPLVCTSVTENGAKEELKWIPLKELDQHHLYPEFYKDKLRLQQTSGGVEYIVTKE